MGSLIQQFLDSELMIQALFVIDAIVFFFYLVAVLYLLIFALFSTDKSRKLYNKAKKKYRYAVIFTAYGEDAVILQSVQLFLEQDYPKDFYEVVVVSDHMQDDTNDQLSKLPIKLLIADYENSSKTKALQFAMDNLDDKAYDEVVIMDADNVTDNCFLDKINDACYSGCMAIQTHRVAKNNDTDTAILDAVSEEINNSIFRMGHVRLGFSSALIGSGMVFKFSWFKKNIVNAIHLGVEKQLESMLLEQHIFIEYLNDVYVYDEKVCKTSAFYSQRRRWLADQKDNLLVSIHKFPMALLNMNFDYCDKLFQWMMPPRVILSGTLLVITVTMLYYNWMMSIKWWGILFLLIFTFSLAIPDRLVDARFTKALKTLPLLFIMMLANMFRLNRSSKRNNATEHTLHTVTVKREGV